MENEESNQIVFSVRISPPALKVRGDIERDMKDSGLTLDGGGMGFGHIDFFVDYNNEEEKQKAIKTGKEIFLKYGLVDVKVEF